MTARIYATAGSRLYIGTALSAAGADLTSASFAGQIWTEIGGTTNLGGAGDTSQLISSNRIAESRVRKAKGTRNSGSMQVVCDIDPADAGQIAVIAAEKTDPSYAFRLVFDDAPSGGSPSERLFAAFVMGAAETYNEANSAMALQISLELDSNIVRVAAA